MGLLSITQEFSDDPASNVIRQIMALFDSTNPGRTPRDLAGNNARQGFWNGSLPRSRIVEAAEQRGHRVKKTLEIDRFAKTVG